MGMAGGVTQVGRSEGPAGHSGALACFAMNSAACRSCVPVYVTREPQTTVYPES